jgi:hypothetical protein
MEIYKLIICGLGSGILVVFGVAQALFFFIFRNLSTEQKELGKKLDTILLNQQAFVREHNCNIDMQSHCNQITDLQNKIDSLTDRVAENEKNVAELKTKINCYHKGN